MFNTALGQDIVTGENMHNGHYHHLDAINAANKAGSIPEAVSAYGLRDGVICACVRNGVPFVLAGSLRDDGPLNGVISCMPEAQDAMREYIRKATTVIALATQLHTIAVGNITPAYAIRRGKMRPVYFYSIDISEFAVNKLRDRGSLSATGIVANIQDFLVNVERNLV